MPRYKFTNKASGEEVQFDWNGTKPPGPADIDRISEEQRQSRLKVKTQNAALDEKSTVDKIMTSDVMGGVLKGADWLGLNQPWHPLDSMSEIGAGAKQIFSGEPTPGTPEANPRTAGLNRAVKGTMGLVGPPLTATGYALNPLGTAAGMVAGHAASTGMGAVIPDDTSPEVRELSQSAAGLVGGALAGGMASRSKFGGTSASTPTVGPNPGTAVGRPIYGQRQPPPRGNGATIMNMGPRQLPAAGPANAGVMPQIAPPVEAPPPVEALTPEVLPPFNYQAGRGAIAPAPSMAQLPTRGTAIPMPPASIPVPEAGTYGRQQITEQAFGSAPRQIEAPQISAPGERPLAPEPKGAADLTPAPTITPEVAAPEVRSQGERTPAPAAPQPRRVVQDIDRNETLKPEIASTLGVGSTRINSKGGVETLQDVPIELVDPTPGNELYPEGNKLYPDKVQEYVNKPSNVAVELRNRNGRFETYEGHHRVEAAKQRGDKSVLAWTSDTGPDNLPLPRAVSEAPPAAPGVPEQPQVRSPEDIARSAIAQASAKPPEVVPPAEVSPAQTELARLQAENVRLKAGKNETIESTVEPAVSIPPQEAKAPVEPKVDSPQNVASAAIRRASEPTGPKVQNPEDYSVAPNQKAEIQMKNKVLDFVKRRVGITPAQIQTEFGLPGTVVDTILADFKGRGLVTVKGGKYNYVKMRGEEISEPVVEPVVKPPTVKAPENILPEPSVKSPIVRPPLAAGRPQSAQNGQDSAAISAKPAISEQKIEGQKTESSGDLVTRLKGGSKKSQQIATELENHTRRLDELETKEDSPEGLTREETNERDTLYSKINKLERDGEYQLKPDIEKYGPRVANMRSIHAEGALSGLSHEQISTRAKAEYGVESMSKMTHEQLAEFEESLRTERMEEETRLIDEDEAEFDSAGKKKSSKISSLLKDTSGSLNLKKLGRNIAELFETAGPDKGILRKRHLQSGETMLENEGLGNIARDIRHTRTEGEKMAGGLVADYQNNIDGFTKAEFDNFLGVIQGTTRASSPMIAAAARAENTRLSRVQGQLGNRNINLDPITSTRTDRALLSDYYTAASRDIQEYQNLGPRVNKIPVDVRTEIDAIKSTGGDYRTAYEFADAYFNPDHLRRVERTMWDRMSSFEIATKLGQSVISNATQSANTALVTGNMTLLKNIARNLTNTSALDALANEISGRVPMSNRELGLRSGSTLSSVTHETQLTSGVKPRGFTDKMLEYTGFSPIEVHNRVVASMSGAEHAVKMFQELKKNPNDTTARRHLSYWLGLDPDVLKNQSQITLDQVLTAAHTLSDRTQHRTSPLEIPLSWRSSVEAKMITLFKSFAFNQAKFMKEVTLNEMKGGNFRTLIPLFTLVPILGTLADRMKRLVTGRDQPKNYWDAVIGAYSSVGGIGIISDLAARAAVGKLAEAVGGPVFSDSVEMIENLFKPKPAKKVKKQLIRNIPVAGKTLVNTDLAK